MELIQYVKIFRKWLWLILVSAIVVGGASFVVVSQRPAVYQAQTIVAIGQYINSPNPNSTEIRTGIDLAQTYAQFVRTSNILEGTIEALSLPFSIDQLRSNITTSVVSNTSLLVITVNYTNPVVVADIANELARQLVEQSPTNLTSEQQAQVTFLNEQITLLNQQITASRDELEQVRQSLESADDSNRETLTAERNRILESINQSQATVAQFVATIASLQQRTNSLDVVEEARVPSTPTGTTPIQSATFGLMLGAILAMGAVLLIEYLDDTVRSTEDAANLLALPVLGSIIQFGKSASEYSRMLLTSFPSLSPVADGYRTIRTNLLYAINEKNKLVIAVTSSSPQEGKTITTSNLAVALAQTGLQVLIIDADLRRPQIHRSFDLDNSVGLTTLLFADPLQHKLVDTSKLPSVLRESIQKTDVPRLYVMASGFIPSNPTEILGSVVMRRWMEYLVRAGLFDVIIIDTPPVLAAADTLVLAKNINAKVLIVVQAGKTRRAAVLRTKNQLQQLEVPLLGVVVNRINQRDEEYGYYNYYYSSATNTSQNPAGKAPGTSVDSSS